MSALPTRILVAVDGSADSVLAARRAVALASAFGSELHVVHVVPVSRSYYIAGEEVEGPALYEEDRQWARELLEEQAGKMEESGGKVTKTYLKAGEPDAEVVALAEEIGASLIVVGSRGLNPLKRPLMGSVSSSIVSHAHCPVLVVRGDGKER